MGWTATLFEAVKRFAAQNLFIWPVGKMYCIVGPVFLFEGLSTLTFFFCFSLELLETLSQMWSPAITTIQDNGVIFLYSTHYLVYYFSCLFLFHPDSLSLKKNPH